MNHSDSLESAIPLTKPRLPGSSTVREPSVATMVGALSRPSGSITSGRDRNGSITFGGMLGITAIAIDSARTCGLSFTVLLSSASWPRARSSTMTLPG